MRYPALILCAVLLVSSAACETAQPKAETKSEAKSPESVDKSVLADDQASLQFKAKIKPIPFAYKSVKLGLKDSKYSVAGLNLDTYMKTAVIPAIEAALKVIPDGKKIIINGHASARGPENAEGGKKGNIAYSQQRAEAVLNYILGNSDIGKERFETRANGSSSPIKDTNPKSSKNCRVELDIE